VLGRTKGEKGRGKAQSGVGGFSKPVKKLYEKSLEMSARKKEAVVLTTVKEHRNEDSFSGADLG